jgi:hypothetical protein
LSIANGSAELLAPSPNPGMLAGDLFPHEEVAISMATPPPTPLEGTLVHFRIEHGTMCPITYELIQENTILYQCTRCRNTFQREALLRWVSTNTSCPTCRGLFSPLTFRQGTAQLYSSSTAAMTPLLLPATRDADDSDPSSFDLGE